MKYLLSLLFSFLAYSLFAQIAVVNPDSVRVGNPAGNGSLSLAGKAYLKNVSEGTSKDSVLVRGADGIIRYVKRSTFAISGIPFIAGDGGSATNGSLIYNSDLQKLRIFDASSSSWKDAISTAGFAKLNAENTAGANLYMSGSINTSNASQNSSLSPWGISNQFGGAGSIALGAWAHGYGLVMSKGGYPNEISRGLVIDPAASPSVHINYFPNRAGTLATLEDVDSMANLAGGSKILEINTQTVNYTIVPLDAGKFLQVNQASANNVTVPASSSSNIPIGTQIIIRQMGAGQTFVKAESGVAIESSKGQALRAQYSTATLVKIATDVWALYGDLVEASPPIASNLLPGLYRISPMPSIFSTTDNETYSLDGSYGEQISMGYKIEGDGIILVKAPFGSPAYHCDVEITTNVNGGDNTDFYFYNGSVVTETNYGSGNGFSELVVEGTFYGLKKVGDNIKLVKTTDGITYIELVDFGSRPGFKYLVTWGYGGSTMLHPQGSGISAIN